MRGIRGIRITTDNDRVKKRIRCEVYAKSELRQIMTALKTHTMRDIRGTEIDQRASKAEGL